MRPHVVAQLAVSLDGVTSGFDVDLARFYALASLWQEDVTLIDAGTILAQQSAVLAAPQRGPRAEGPLLAVVDERARVQCWDSLRELGYWSGVLDTMSLDDWRKGRLVGSVDEVAEQLVRWRELGVGSLVASLAALPFSIVDDDAVDLVAAACSLVGR